MENNNQNNRAEAVDGVKKDEKDEKDEKVDLRRLCDGCLKLCDDGDFYAFKVIDSYNFSHPFKGHSKCLDEIIDKLRLEFPKFTDQEELANQ